MKKEDREAILARNRQPAKPVQFAQPKTLQRIIDANKAAQANRLAAEQDELRTEGHQPTRRPLSNHRES